MGSKDTVGRSGYFHRRLRKLSWILHGSARHTIYLVELVEKSLVLKTVMNNSTQNIFNQQQSLLTPGRVITEAKQYQSPSGKIVNLQKLTVTVQDNQGIWRTEVIVKVDRPLDDGTTPNDCSEIRECFCCQSLIHVNNSYMCPTCCQCFCLPCTENIKLKDKEVRVCVACAKEAKTPVVLNILRKAIWGQ